MQAEDLYGAERSTHSFARLRIGKQTPQQTNVVWSSCNPIWEEALSFRWGVIPFWRHAKNILVSEQGEGFVGHHAPNSISFEELKILHSGHLPSFMTG